MEEKATDLFRYKGVINVVGEDRKFVFQGVHMLFSGDFTEEWTKDEVRDSRFVFIGRNLDKDEITTNFLGCSVDLNLRFEVGTKVLCRRRKGKRKGSTLQAYDKGVVIKQWDEGNPYRVRLDKGDLEIWAPDDVDEIIMECTPEIEAQMK